MYLIVKESYLKMKHPEILDLYTDYLIACFGKATATGLSSMLDKSISHDKISRFLNQPTLNDKDYWKVIKPIIRKVETPQGILKIDDFIEEKPYTDENAIVCFHWDHSKNTHVKGMNILHFNYSGVSSEEGTPFRLPVAWEIIKKTQEYACKKTGKIKRRSDVSKNELLRRRLRVLTSLNKLEYEYIVWDSWFSSKENLEFVHYELKKKFVVALKSNRLIALSLQDKNQGKFQRIDSLDLQPYLVYTLYLKGLDFPVRVVKRVFTNKDGSKGELYIITNDFDLTYDQILEIYHERWSIEDAHKSLKNNVCLQDSPTQKVESQSNHVFSSMIALVKLEILKFKERKNHFALKAKLYVKALKAAFQELQEIKKTSNKQPILIRTKSALQNVF